MLHYFSFGHWVGLIRSRRRERENRRDLEEKRRNIPHRAMTLARRYKDENDSLADRGELLLSELEIDLMHLLGQRMNKAGSVNGFLTEHPFFQESEKIKRRMKSRLRAMRRINRIIAAA